MTTAFDIFPDTDEAPAAPAPRTVVATAAPSALDADIEKLDLEALALARFAGSRTAVAEATRTLTNVVHDLSTPGKIADAKSLRERVINAPLAEARKIEKGLKSKLTATSKAVGAALVSIEAAFADAAKLITPQIEAADAKLAAEKAEREAKEAARTGAHRANIAKIAGYVQQASGRTSAEVLMVINGLNAIEIDPAAWEEFAAGAEAQKAETLDALQVLFDRTKAAEDEAAAREAQRIENERKAAELAEQQRILAEKQAELDAKLAMIAAAERAEADRIAAEAKAVEDAARAEAEAAARQAAEDEANAQAQETAAAAVEKWAPEEVRDDALAVRPEIAESIMAVEPPAAADIDDIASKAWAMPVTFAEPPAPSADEPATLNLTAINDRFGGVLTVTAASLALMGIHPSATVKASKLYRESQFLALCDALVEHIGEVVSACEA